MPKHVERVNVTGTPKSVQMTVPAGAKSGILVICGSHWNAYQIKFTDPTGAGIVSATKLHDAYGGAHANLHIVIYEVALKSGGAITVNNSSTGLIGSEDVYSGTSMVLLY